MQGFTTKYYLCEAERGDFVVNLQVTTLHTNKDMANTFATQFPSGRPKVDMRACGSLLGTDVCKRWL